MSATLVLALTISMLAAFACYASLRHCRWTSIRRWRKSSMTCAGALSMLSIGLWISAYGIAVGICAMLGTYMLSLAALPWIALFTGSTNAVERD
jgi:hypothetical protein